MAEASTSDQVPPPPAPLNVLYCAICTFPPEYCEFGSHVTKCKAWLKDNHAQLFERYYGEDAVQSKLQALSVEAQSKLEEDAAKKEAKATAKAEVEAKKKQASRSKGKPGELLSPLELTASKVLIKRVERNKRKCVTTIYGLEAFGIDLKKAAKQFATKFATGSSVTKNAQGQEEIVVQGDVAEDILEIIEEGGGSGPLAALLKTVPAEQVVLVDESKKK
ncbi:Translation machinery-associated protein 22 [Tulasnella sp. 403]|nr:Translation machinery-associated protein 22 [Tulasnella sp. 403]